MLADTPGQLTGISSLAIGADQLFARVVLDIGGRLYAVIPFPEYERTFHSPDAREAYLRYVHLAAWKEVLEPCGRDEEGFLAAGKRVVSLADSMVAIWDGTPARGLGGTGDIVRVALIKSIKVVRVDPVSRQIMDM